MNIKPIEKQDLPDVIYSAKHQCNNRVLIPNVHKRKHLRYLCKKQLNKLKPSETYIPEVEQEKSWEFLEYVAAKSHPIVHQLLKAFVNKTQHDAVLEVLARLLYMMSGDAALSSVLPFLSHDLIEECIKDMEGNAPTPHSKLLQVENFCMELAGFPLRLENLENLEKWEGILQSGKSQGILNRLEKSGKSQGKPHKILEKLGNLK